MPGTYTVGADVEDGFHLFMRCSRGRQTPFEVDFTGAFFYFTVSYGPSGPHGNAWACMKSLSQAA